MSIIIYAPQGAGKGLHAEQLRRFYKLSRVIEDGEDGVDLGAVNSHRTISRIKSLNALILTNRDLSRTANMSRHVLSLGQALQQMKESDHV